MSMPGRTSRGLTICMSLIRNNMEKNQILDIVIKNIKSIKDMDNISLSNRFKEDLGFDSTDMLFLILKLEEEFHVSFSEPFIVLKVQDALDFIQKHL